MKPTLSIVIGAYREEKRIGKTLKSLANFLDNNLKDYKVEVIVVAADSPDDTVGVVKSFQPLFKKHALKLLRPGPKVGKGRDIQYGMLRAKGGLCFFMDADLATPLRHLKPAIRKLENNADVVIGIRDIKKIHAGIRSVLSRAGNLLSKIMINVYHTDTQCGFKGFTSQAARLCFGKQMIMGWGFDIELLAIAKEHELNVAEVPIHDWKDVSGGTIDENITRAALRTLDELVTIRRNLKTGYYK